MPSLTFFELPQDILLTIFSSLSGREFGLLAKTSKQLQVFFKDEAFWKKMVERDLTAIPIHVKEYSAINNEGVFFNRVNKPSVAYQNYYAHCHTHLLAPMAKLKKPDHVLETGMFQGKSVLDAAACLGCELIVYKLHAEILNLANIEADANGETFLHKAIRAGCSKLFIQQLLDKSERKVINQGSGADINHYPLGIAIQRKNEEIVSLLLEKGAEINNSEYLFTAVELGCSSVVNLLLSNGAKKYINGLNSYGQTPLHLAAGSSDPETLRIILENGGDKNIHDKAPPNYYPYQQTPLHCLLSIRPLESICIDRMTQCLNLLFKYGAKSDINAVDANGNTPLNDSSMDVSIVQMLIDNGADIFLFNSKGRTPLIRACYYKSFSTLKLLMEQGLKKYVNKASEDDFEEGVTPLLAAGCYYSNHEVSEIVDIFNYLLANGADIYRHDLRGATLLHYLMRSACSPRMGNSLFKLINNPQFSTQITRQDNDGNLALHEPGPYFIQDNFSQEQLTERLAILSEFLDSGASALLNCENFQGNTPFEAIVSSTVVKKNISLLHLLIEKGTQLRPEKEFVEGNTLLHEVLHDACVLEFLLKIGYLKIIDTPNHEGNTPIHIAAKQGCFHSVRVLIQAGCSPTKKNLHNQTPLHLACSDHWISDAHDTDKGAVLNTLLSHYMIDDLQLKDENGKAALDLARETNLRHIVQILERDLGQKQNVVNQQLTFTNTK